KFCEDNDNKRDGNEGICEIIEHVESICSMLSCRIIVGKDEDDELNSIDGDKHEQLANEVTLFINAKRIGMQ
ncbi:unnamed protein product, partial [Rotaria magnacalcarata]